MKKQIISEKTKKEAIQPTIGFTCALAVVVLCGLFDVRELGVDIGAGTETTMYWIVRIICILCIPLMAFLLFKSVKQLFKGDLMLKISEDGIYLNIHKDLNTTIQYEDIEKVSFKEYPNDQYIIFIFLKDPSKYLSEAQIERNYKAKEKVPESGDIAIPSLFLKEEKEVVIDLINSYRMQVD